MKMFSKFLLFIFLISNNSIFTMDQEECPICHWSPIVDASKKDDSDEIAENHTIAHDRDAHIQNAMSLISDGKTDEAFEDLKKYNFFESFIGIILTLQKSLKGKGKEEVARLAREGNATATEFAAENWVTITKKDWPKIRKHLKGLKLTGNDDDTKS